MKRYSLLVLSLSLVSLWLLTSSRAAADSGHARIVRLSLVQGDVRFAREFHKDSMEDAKAVWEIAPLNLPLREGYALATDANSRAEVEFENGAMAFLSANTLVEFYDLSLDDGALITRLVLRQGSAIFYVHPGKGDYFSVTGGDFSVEANGRTRFRLDNFDDGSNVAVEVGEINVLRNKKSKPLAKGQSYSINMNASSDPIIGRAPEYDDFDKWVSGRVDAVATATAYSSQYVNSSDYTAGFADLYNYGSFYNVPGYGYGWQPYGAGLGWNPFAFGSWYSDPFLGWNFIGSAPWGWLPYHYGGWIFSPVYGWLWMPTGFGYGGYGYGYRGPLSYHPVTAVWVRSGTATGLVPLHPGDAHGKAPINLANAVYSVEGNKIGSSISPVAGEKWTVVKNPPHNTLTLATLQAATQPTRVSRTILAGRAVTLSRDSSIVYDPAQHRFVNNGDPAKTVESEVKTTNTIATGSKGNAVLTGGTEHAPNAPTVAHSNVMPARPHINPPNPPSNGGSSHHGGAIWNNTLASSASTSHTTTSAPAPSGHAGGGHH